MDNNVAKVGAGRFQWNAGGWFGSSLGGTAFLVAGAVAFSPADRLLSAIWLCCFAAVASVSIGLWVRRTLIQPYPAIQILLLACSLSGTVAIIAALYMAPNLLPAVQLSPTKSLILLLLFPLLMLWFHILESAARRTT